MVEGCEAPNKVITKVLDFKLVLEDSKDFAKHKNVLALGWNVFKCASVFPRKTHFKFDPSSFVGKQLTDVYTQTLSNANLLQRLYSSMQRSASFIKLNGPYSTKYLPNLQHS